MLNSLLWDVPGGVMAAPASALCGWKGVNSLSFSLSRLCHTPGNLAGPGAWATLCRHFDKRWACSDVPLPPPGMVCLVDFALCCWTTMLTHVGRQYSQMFPCRETIGLPPWQMRSAWHLDNVGMYAWCTRSSLSAAPACMRSGICQGMSWQHLHQPCVAGKVQYSLSRK